MKNQFRTFHGDLFPPITKFGMNFCTFSYLGIAVHFSLLCYLLFRSVQATIKLLGNGLRHNYLFTEYFGNFSRNIERIYFRGKLFNVYQGDSFSHMVFSQTRRNQLYQNSQNSQNLVLLREPKPDRTQQILILNMEIVCHITELNTVESP